MSDRVKAGLGALALLLGTVLVFFGPSLAGLVNGAVEDAQASLNKHTVISDEMVDKLTVETASADAECESGNTGVVDFNIGALAGIPPRLWSDALSTPFTATVAEDVRNELQRTICEDPLLGVSYLVFFATDVRDTIKSDTGVDIVDLNPWLKPFATKPSQINQLAAGFIPLLDVKDRSKINELKSTAFDMNIKWQETAGLLNTLFDRFAVVGIEARESVVNYHLAAGGLVVGSLPAVERNPNQEDLPALILSLTEKDQCEDLLTIGANMGDKRPELFGDRVCETPGCEGEGCNPPCSEDCGPPPCVTNCEPPCTVNCEPCPPGNTIPDCAPKSPNPGDYTYPPGKPPVTETNPPEETPPPVVTEETGGGGVVDTPTNDPGSETGTTAPDADPPAPETTPPPNQGGNGDGTVGGF